jgi:hypothetical protein
VSFNPSGGGIGSATDVALSNPVDNEVLTYNSSTAKWSNEASAGGTGAGPGEVLLDSFAGANDDAKLAAAMTYASAQTFMPAIRLTNRAHTFTQTLGQPYDGFTLIGSSTGWGDQTPRTKVTLNITPAAGDTIGYWINCSSAQVWDYYIGNINFVSSNTKTQFIRTQSSTSSVLWNCTFHNLSFASFYAVLGNSAEALTIDLCEITGTWSILQAYDTPVALKGADNRAIFRDGLNIGSGTTPAAGANGKYLLWFTSLSKSNIGPMYITADNGWRGIKYQGSSSSGYGTTITGAVIEGRNPGDPCVGILVNVIGGAVTLRDCNVNCGMTAPSAGENGLIQISGTDTQVVIDGCSFGHATGVAVTTPCVYVTGTAAQVRVRNVTHSVRSGGPTWGTQLPVVQQTTAGLVKDSDTSISLV